MRITGPRKGNSTGCENERDPANKQPSKLSQGFVTLIDLA